MTPLPPPAAPASPSPPLLLTVGQAADMLAIGRSAVYTLLANRTLASVRIGRSRRIPTAAITTYVAELLAQNACQR
jgi:excisionase family DNA binding protein